MKGIDISNWQNGINLSAVPCDFVIIKATQGTSYVSPDFHRQIEQALSLGKYVGVYHYIGGQGAKSEAEHFVKTVKPYLKRVILCLDWEKEQNSKFGNTSYLEQVAQAVIDMTGIRPLDYASLSGFPWDVAKKQNCGTWVAQYANMNVTGYQDSPWNESAYSCTIRQYSSKGRLSGWGGDLDLNKAYITGQQWMKYACPDGGTPEQAPTPTPADTSLANMDVTDIVADVMRGKYGDDEERKAALGARYDEVQALINHIDRADAATLADEVWAGDYGNGSKREAILGRRYEEVRAIVNAGGSTGRIYTVVSGDTLSGIGQKLGIKWQTIASKNGISSPYTIYPGQRLTY